MKKWIVVGLSLAVAGIGSSVFAATPESTAPNSPVVTNTANLPPSVVDDIAIPYDVVMYAQLEYQGYAITHAYKETRNGQAAYRLQITRDDTGSGYDGYQLWYDMNWKLVTQEKLTRPVIKKEEPKPQPQTPTPPPAAPQQPSNNDNDGGRGGGDNDDEDKPDDDKDDKDEDEAPRQGGFPFNN